MADTHAEECTPEENAGYELAASMLKDAPEDKVLCVCKHTDDDGWETFKLVHTGQWTYSEQLGALAQAVHMLQHGEDTRDG